MLVCSRCAVLHPLKPHSAHNDSLVTVTAHILHAVLQMLQLMLHESNHGMSIKNGMSIRQRGVSTVHQAGDGNNFNDRVHNCSQHQPGITCPCSLNISIRGASNLLCALNQTTLDMLSSTNSLLFGYHWNYLFKNYLYCGHDL